MVELPDLFHENRIHELSLSLILYAPFGLCLVLIRSFALILLFILSCVFASNSSVDQLLNTAISWIFTITCVNEKIEENRRRTKIIVANRVSLFDSIVLRKIISNDRCKVVNLTREYLFDHWLKSSTIIPSHTKEDLLDFCTNEIQRNDTQLLFLPECETTTGTDGLLKFNLTPFTLAQNLQLSILPICLHVSRPFHIRASTFNSQPSADLFWFLFTPYTEYHIDFLPIISSTDSPSAEIFSEQVRENMARKMNIELTQFDELELTELKKRPDLFRHRHTQRRAEFQQMISQVHQQVPQASVEAIRYDLERTKDIQRTIANLNERALAAARAAAAAAAAANQSTTTTSSRAINKSTNSTDHRQTYERLKEELIEKNRQLFLQKNSN